MQCILILALVGCLGGGLGFTIHEPEFELMNPGLRIKYKHEDGMSLVAVHYNIDRSLAGTAAGEVNEDIRQKTGDYWIHENPSVNVKIGSTVGYWILVLANGQGHQLTDKTHTFTEPTTTTTTTPKPTTTTTPRPTTTTTPYTGPSTTTTEGPSTTTTTRAPGSGGGGGSCDCGSGGGVPKVQCDSYPCLIFEDEFDTLNFNVWEHEITLGGGGNWEFQYYTNNRSNSYVRDGTLFLKPTLTTDKYGDDFLQSGTLEVWGNHPPNQCTGNQWWGCRRQGTGTNYINPIQSARLRTAKSFSMKYGKIEFEAKLPQGDWIWPALWMLPAKEEYGMWPTSGEIDIMESRGNRNYKDRTGQPIGVDAALATLHWGPFWGYNRYDLTTTASVMNGGNYGQNFHTYGCEWDEDHISMYLDGKETLRVDPGADGFWEFGEFAKLAPGAADPWVGGNKMTPFDREFYIIMNVAVGGTNGFFPDDGQNSPPKPWHNESPTGPRDFWNARAQWYPTWKPEENNGEEAAMQIKSVKVWKLKPDP